LSGKTELNGENLAISMKLLDDVTRVLERFKVPYFLEGGTLLGVVREQRLLPWDTDMDISMDKVYQGRLLTALFVLIFKYRVSIKYYSCDIGPFKKNEVRIVKVRNYSGFLRKGNAQLDVFLKRKEGDRFFWTVGDKNMVLKQAPAPFYEHLSTLDFNGKPYGVPADYEAYLTFRYGDWKTPVKTWDFKKDDLAIVNESNE